MSGKKKKKELKAREEVKSITSRSTKEVKKKEKSTLISIRLSDNMIKDLKHIADVFGIGYQTLIKHVLNDYIEAATKKKRKQIHPKDGFANLNCLKLFYFQIAN